jgi:hypothetical protein
MLCSCRKTSDKDSLLQIQESVTTELAGFVAATEGKPVTVTELIDGFTFNMSPKQYQVRYSELQKLECDNARLEINGPSYYAHYCQPSFCDGKLFELNILLLYKEPCSEIVTKADFDSLAVYFKTIYGSDSSHYMFTEHPVSEFPTHHWRKDNLYFQLSWVTGEEMTDAISLIYKNNGISGRFSDSP